MLKVLDLFCGAGGLSLGFKLAGFKIIGGVDQNKDAINTYKKNFPEATTFFNNNICEISNEEIREKLEGKVDVIIGGPPCQGFSAGNRQQIENDPRNKLFFEFIRFVRILSPRVVVIENVRQILSKDNGFAKKKIFEILEELGYSVDVRVFNAQDYGVPQKRNRAIFIALKDAKKIDFDKIRRCKSVSVKDAIGDLYEIENTDCFIISSEPKSDFQKYARRIDGIITNHEKKLPGEIVLERIKHVPQGGNWRDVPSYLWTTERNNRHSSAYKRLNENLPSITIDTGHMNYFHPIFDRVPTVRESARLQSFPDSFEFTGSQTSQYRQVGNAVPPLLAYAIATLIKESIKDD